MRKTIEVSYVVVGYVFVVVVVECVTSMKQIENKKKTHGRESNNNRILYRIEKMILIFV